jgi:hypothetical protein
MVEKRARSSTSTASGGKLRPQRPSGVQKKKQKRTASTSTSANRANSMTNSQLSRKHREAMKRNGNARNELMRVLLNASGNTKNTATSSGRAGSAGPTRSSGSVSNVSAKRQRVASGNTKNTATSSGRAGSAGHNNMIAEIMRMSNTGGPVNSKQKNVPNYSSTSFMRALIDAPTGNVQNTAMSSGNVGGAKRSRSNGGATNVATKRQRVTGTSRPQISNVSNRRTATTIKSKNINKNAPVTNTANSGSKTGATGTSTKDMYMVPTTYFKHQKDAVQIAKASAKSFLDLRAGRPVPIKYRGGVVWHGTGSGKTVSGLGILMQYIKISDKLRRAGRNPPYLVVVTTIANERQNGMDTYLRNLMKYHPDYAIAIAKEVAPTIGENREIDIFEALKKSFTKRVKFLSYQKFANCLSLFGYTTNETDGVCKQMRSLQVVKGKLVPRFLVQGMVVILDESHELIKADMKDLKDVDPKARILQNQYQSILQTKKMLFENVRNPFLHVYCLTATPGTSIQEYVDTLNLTRPVGMKELNADTIFKNELRKHVHHVNLTGNRRYFAEMGIKHVQTPISKEHYLITLGFIAKHRKKADEEHKKIISDPNAGKNNRIASQLIYRFYRREAYLAKARQMENWFDYADFNTFAKCYTEPENSTPAIKGGKVVVKKGNPSKQKSGKQVCDEIAELYYKVMVSLAGRDTGTINRLKLIFPAGKAVVKMGHKSLVVSPKLFIVARNIVETPGKQFVYASDSMTNEIIAHMIHKMYGYADATDAVAAHTLMYREPNKNAVYKKHPHYILVKDPNGKGIETFQAFMSGLNMEQVGKTTRWEPEIPTEEKFKRNAHGEMCKIIFVTGELYTGVDINALRGVHILNPFASRVSAMQARGRATRSKGHEFLPNANKNAMVYEYMSKVSSFNGNHQLSIYEALACVKPNAKEYNNYKAAYQWMKHHSRIKNGFRVNGKTLMNLDDPSKILPTADSVVERQQMFDKETEKLLAFEAKLKRHLAKTKTRIR